MEQAINKSKEEKKDESEGGEVVVAVAKSKRRKLDKENELDLDTLVLASVYYVRNLWRNVEYVGSSSRDIGKRPEEHIRKYLFSHEIPKLYFAMRFFGHDSFEMDYLETIPCTKEDFSLDLFYTNLDNNYSDSALLPCFHCVKQIELHKKEAEWIVKKDSIRNGYNSKIPAARFPCGQYCSKKPTHAIFCCRDFYSTEKNLKLCTFQSCSIFQIILHIGTIHGKCCICNQCMEGNFELHFKENHPQDSPVLCSICLEKIIPKLLQEHVLENHPLQLFLYQRFLQNKKNAEKKLTKLKEKLLRKAESLRTHDVRYQLISSSDSEVESKKEDELELKYQEKKEIIIGNTLTYDYIVNVATNSFSIRELEKVYSMLKNTYSNCKCFSIYTDIECSICQKRFSQNVKGDPIKINPTGIDLSFRYSCRKDLLEISEDIIDGIIELHIIKEHPEEDCVMIQSPKPKGICSRHGLLSCNENITNSALEKHKISPFCKKAEFCLGLDIRGSVKEHEENYHKEHYICKKCDNRFVFTIVLFAKIHVERFHGISRWECNEWIIPIDISFE